MFDIDEYSSCAVPFFFISIVQGVWGVAEDRLQSPISSARCATPRTDIVHSRLPGRVRHLAPPSSDDGGDEHMAGGKQAGSKRKAAGSRRLVLGLDTGNGASGRGIGAGRSSRPTGVRIAPPWRDDAPSIHKAAVVVRNRR